VEITIVPSVYGASIEESDAKVLVIEELVQIRLLFRITRAK
jgi:hypothetical protein